MRVRPYKREDWPSVESITREGIATGVATFETEPKTQSTWEKESLQGSQLVAEAEDRTILGWTILWPASDRCVYAGVAEVSVYVSAEAQGRGVGKALLRELIRLTEEELDIWTIQAGIFEDNPGSIALHKACGFRILGYRERIGKLHGVWRNNLQLERRSSKVGI
ncbi:MAG: N-acetyltransferase [Kordiimonadales bacterium]|nr:MAG: N-acetyltransferase [Kordiimonadales bacterium]